MNKKGESMPAAVSLLLDCPSSAHARGEVLMREGCRGVIIREVQRLSVHDRPHEEQQQGEMSGEIFA